MPRIPESHRRGPTAFPASTTPEQVANTIGGGLASLGGAVERLARERVARVRSEKLLAGMKTLNELELETQDLDPIERVEKYTELAQERLATLAGDDAELQERFGLEASRRVIPLARAARATSQRRELATLAELQDETLNQVLDAPDDELRGAVIEGFEAAVDDSSQSEETKTELVAQFQGRAQRLFLSRMIEEDPQQALGAIGNFDALSAEEREKFRLVAETAVEKRTAERHALAGAELDIRVARGQATEEEVRAAQRRGEISPATMGRLVKRLDAQKAEGLQNHEAELAVALALQGDAFTIDPTSREERKILERLFQRTSEAFLAQQPTEGEFNEFIADFALDAGAIPTSLEGELRGALRSNDPARVRGAADVFDRIGTRNPAILRDLPKAEMALTQRVADLTRAGVPGEEAARQALEAARQAPSEREALLDVYREEEFGADNAGWLQGEAEFPGLWDPNVPPAMLGEFNFLVEDAFLRQRGEDIDSARKAALKYALRVWRPTEVNGREEWMKYAPETYYANRRGTSWIREQLVSDVRERTGREFDEDAIRFQPDLETAREAETGRPSYTVLLRNDLGEFEPLFDADGTVPRVAPDWASSPDGAAQRAKVREMRSQAFDRQASAASSSIARPAGRFRQQVP